MQRLMNCGYSEIYFPLLSKLEGLYSLTNDEDFLCYRRTIFECLNLLNNLMVTKLNHKTLKMNKLGVISSKIGSYIQFLFVKNTR